MTKTTTANNDKTDSSLFYAGIDFIKHIASALFMFTFHVYVYRLTVLKFKSSPVLGLILTNDNNFLPHDSQKRICLFVFYFLCFVLKDVPLYNTNTKHYQQK